MESLAWRKSHAWCLIALLAITSGCKIVSIEEDRQLRQQRSEDFDAVQFLDQRWREVVVPELVKRAVPFSDLSQMIAQDVAVAGARHGHQAGEGSPWTFVTKGEGVVTARNNESREGTIEVRVGSEAGASSILIQTGPVIVDSSIRDALPFFDFNDFSGQIAFAEVGRALTNRALKETAPTIGQLSVGDRVSFLGTFDAPEDSEHPRLTAVRLSKVEGN